MSSSCVSLCTFTVTSEFLGSDHSIVLTNVNANTTPEDHGVPKWKFSKADWQKFSSACDQTLTSFSIALSYAFPSLKLVFAKLLWILFHNPRSLLNSLFHGGVSSATLLWKRKHAFNRMKRTWLLSDIIIFERCRTRAKKVCTRRQAKSSSWRQFCMSLTSNSNLTSLEVIISFSGHRSSYFIQTTQIQHARKPVRFIQQLSKLSAAICQCDPTNPNATIALSHTTPIDPDLNQDFSINELLFIKDTKNTTRGPDNICYEMFKHMSIKSPSHATAV